MPVADLSHSVERWCNEPLPGEPYVIGAERTLVAATSSATVLIFCSGLTASNQRTRCRYAYRREILQRAIRQLLVQTRVDGQHAGITQQQRVAVRRRARHQFRPDDAAGAAAVIHDNLLAERLLQFQRNNTAHDVRAATGRLRHNKAHRFSGVGLRYNHGGSDPAGTNEVDEVLFHHSLEHLGRETRVFFGIIQELYRVCKAGAKVQINVPHPRHDHFMGDPPHVRAITPPLLAMFSKKENERWKKWGALILRWQST